MIYQSGSGRQTNDLSASFLPARPQGVQPASQPVDHISEIDHIVIQMYGDI